MSGYMTSCASAGAFAHIEDRVFCGILKDAERQLPIMRIIWTVLVLAYVAHQDKEYSYHCTGKPAGGGRNSPFATSMFLGHLWTTTSKALVPYA